MTSWLVVGIHAANRHVGRMLKPGLIGKGHALPPQSHRFQALVFRLHHPSRGLLGKPSALAACINAWRSSRGGFYKYKPPDLLADFLL